MSLKLEVTTLTVDKENESIVRVFLLYDVLHFEFTFKTAKWHQKYLFQQTDENDCITFHYLLMQNDTQNTISTLRKWLCNTKDSNFSTAI